MAYFGSYFGKPATGTSLAFPNLYATASVAPVEPDFGGGPRFFVRRRKDDAEVYACMFGLIQHSSFPI